MSGGLLPNIPGIGFPPSFEIVAQWLSILTLSLIAVGCPVDRHEGRAVDLAECQKPLGKDRQVVRDKESHGMVRQLV